MIQETPYSPEAQLAASSAAKRRERSVRGPCSSAEGGAGACSISANADPRLRRTARVASRAHSSIAIVAISPWRTRQRRHRSRPSGRRASRRRRSLFPRAIVRLACPARPLSTECDRAASAAGTIAFSCAAASVGAIAMATERNSRSKSVLAHRWLATAGLGVALGRQSASQLETPAGDQCDRADRARRSPKCRRLQGSETSVQTSLSAYAQPAGVDGVPVEHGRQFFGALR